MVIGGRRKVAGPLLVRALNGCSAPREKTPPASSELRVMNAVWGKGSSDCDETTRLPGSFVTTALMHALLLVEFLLFVLPLLCSQVIASVKSIIW
jgi:hypothetical protein